MAGGWWGSVGDVGTFHSICDTNVELSHERKVAIGKGYEHNFVFSNDQISIGLKFSVKILKETSNSLPYVSPISSSFTPRTSNIPYKAEGAVHVVHYCLFFVQADS